MHTDDIHILPLEWNDYLIKLEDIYLFYLENIHNKLTFLNKPVLCREQPEFDNKFECFWHIITEDLYHNKKHKNGIHKSNKEIIVRNPDIERCRRINLIPFIINNYNDPRIRCWEKIESTKKGKQNRIYLWLEISEYLVILGENNTNFHLVTAYFTNYNHTKEKLRNDCRIYNDPR